MPTNSPDLLNSGLPENLKRVQIPTVDATPDSLDGYGFLVDSPEDIQIEIERWPAQGWRPVDLNTGNEGGTTEGIFKCE